MTDNKDKILKPLDIDKTDRELLQECYTMLHSLSTRFCYLEKRVATVELYERILGLSIGAMVAAVIVFQIIITIT